MALIKFPTFTLVKLLVMNVFDSALEMNEDLLTQFHASFYIHTYKRLCLRSENYRRDLMV